MDSNLEGKWLRKCTPMESVMCEQYLHGHRLWFQMDLSSSQPLQEDDVRKALCLLYKKTPNLTVCYGMRNGEFWLKQATRLHDFKVLHNECLEDVRSSLHYYNFNTEEGPLICARLLTETYQEDEDLEPEFPHKYYFLFGIHHVLVDGTAAMNLCGFFITLLNEVIAKIPIDDSQLLGDFVSDEETQKIINAKQTLIKEDPRLEQELSKIHQIIKHQKPLVLKLSPKQSDREKVICFFTVLDQETTTKFLTKCKMEKVTVNSLISSIVHIALVEILSEEEVVQDSYLLHSSHAVNLRRYWMGNSSKTLGCHMGFPLIFSATTPRDVRSHFWEFTKHINSDLKDDIVSGKVLLYEAYIRTLSDNDNAKDSCKIHNEFEGDFATSSLGDVTDIVTIGGNHVRVTSVKISTGILSTGIPVLFSYLTFRGRFMISYAFNSKVLSLETGEKLLSDVVKFIKEL